MNWESEQILEDKLIAQLEKLQYTKVVIKDENDLLANLKTQLEKHNNITFSDKVFERVLTCWAKVQYLKKSKRYVKNNILNSPSHT